jgi:hypothetical protein
LNEEVTVAGMPAVIVIVTEAPGSNFRLAVDFFTLPDRTVLQLKPDILHVTPVKVFGKVLLNEALETRLVPLFDTTMRTVNEPGGDTFGETLSMDKSTR